MVGNVVRDLGLKYSSIGLGEVDFADFYGEKLTADVEVLLSNELEKLGFFILADKKSQVIEGVKKSCIDYLNGIEISNKNVLSSHISSAVELEYNYLSHLFSTVEGITIEQHFIRLRVEKVKELLIYGELTLGEIAFKLGFSSAAHLSGQFKKITGLTPDYFRTIRNQKLRSSLDNLKIL